MNYNDLKKLRLDFRAWILAKAENDKEYYKVLEALNVAEKYHSDNRKDGSPTMIHQMSIVQYLKTMVHVIEKPVDVFVAALLHDTYEDYPESFFELKEKFPKQLEYIIRVSKMRYEYNEDGEVVDTVKLSNEKYYSGMAKCPVCSVIKPTDRIHNVYSMVNVFSHDKQTRYLEEVDDFVLPLIKAAKRLFPQQTPIYENMKSFLLVKRDLIRNMREQYNLVADIEQEENLKPGM